MSSPELRHGIASRSTEKQVFSLWSYHQHPSEKYSSEPKDKNKHFYRKERKISDFPI